MTDQSGGPPTCSRLPLRGLLRFEGYEPHPHIKAKVAVSRRDRRSRPAARVEAAIRSPWSSRSRENGVIGQGGALPWRLKSEMRHFRDVTWGKPVVVGRKTYELVRPQAAAGADQHRGDARPHALDSRCGGDDEHRSGARCARGDALRRGIDVISCRVAAPTSMPRRSAEADRLVVTARQVATCRRHGVSADRSSASGARSNAPTIAAGPEDEADIRSMSYERNLPP